MRKRSPLNKQKIIKAALQIINKQGLAALSMRSLALKLKVEAASLYNHVNNKAQLLDLIQASCYTSMPQSDTKPTWQKHLKQLADFVRQGLLSVPNLVPLFATRPTITEESLKQLEQTSVILIAAGFKAADVMLIFRNLHVFIIGHVLAEVGKVPGEKEVHDDPTFDQFDMQQYPTLQAVFAVSAGADFDRGFDIGIDALIAGLEHYLK